MMGRRLSYFFDRVLTDIGQNPLSSAANILVLTVCLLFLGVSSILYKGFQQLIPTWMLEAQAVVFLLTETSLQDQEKLAQELKKSPEIESISIVSGEEARSRLETQLGEWKGILAGLQKNPLPPSLEIRFKGREKHPERIDALLEKITQNPQVEEVLYGKGRAEKLESLLNTAKPVALGGLCLFVAAAVLMVSNTIRLAVSSRSDELEIYSIVGATPFFIKFPFYLEGVLQGVVSALLASGLLLFLLWESRSILPFPIAAALPWKGVEVFLLSLGLLASGLALGWLGSWISLRRTGQ